MRVDQYPPSFLLLSAQSFNHSDPYTGLISVSDKERFILDDQRI